MDSYPIPRIDDLFTKLTGGKSFSKLDLSQAYLQVELDEELKKLAVINTHRGLFKYNRLPFGLSSALGIFQHAMELLHDSTTVAVYLGASLSQELLKLSIYRHLTRCWMLENWINQSKVFMAPSVMLSGPQD